ncbi:dual specificity protein kinase shkE-like isoform X1 [Armigeres subalbatus]|uniref:dual specificity protein kinase shkE-like isoform X1 n=1 Tax=Armigeres subalbatus TaxID=124917 RepID=UPI002ED1C913
MCDNESAVSSTAGANGNNNNNNNNTNGTPTTNGLLVEAINPAVHMASSLSAPSMQQQIQKQQQNEFLTAQDLAMENHWLREKLKEVTSDRDRLLCEVANLRLELDMAELKRLPEDRYGPNSATHDWNHNS